MKKEKKDKLDLRLGTDFSTPVPEYVRDQWQILPSKIKKFEPKKL